MRVQTKPAHINATKEQIADVVLMPGDPLRAKYIAQNFLDDAELVTDVRNMLGFTGTYKGKRVTVMGSGMGMPSVGIYSYELYHFYDVEKIIRIGSCGNPLDPETKLRDIIIADSAYSEANFAYQLYRDEGNYIEADKELTDNLEKEAIKKGVSYKKGTILTTEVFDFYISDLKNYMHSLKPPKPIVAAEMEAYGLFHVANYLGKKAACVATVVDSHFVDEFISIEDREKDLNEMITIALESIL